MHTFPHLTRLKLTRVNSTHTDITGLDSSITIHMIYCDNDSTVYCCDISSLQGIFRANVEANSLVFRKILCRCYQEFEIKYFLLLFATYTYCTHLSNFNNIQHYHDSG